MSEAYGISGSPIVICDDLPDIHMSATEARKLQEEVRKLERQLLDEKQGTKAFIHSLLQERIRFYNLQEQASERMRLKLKESESRILAQLRQGYLSELEEKDGLISELGVKLSEAETALEGSPGEKCGVCGGLCEVVTQCGHEFCESCIDKWRYFSPQQDCPVCRIALDQFVGEEATVIKLRRR